MNNPIDKIPMPQNTYAEEAVIGCMLIEASIIPDVMSKLSEHDFYKLECSLIYKTIASLEKDNKEINLISVANDMKLNKMDIPYAKLVEYINTVQTVDSYKSYVEIVKEKSMARSIILSSNRLMNNMYSCKSPLFPLQMFNASIEKIMAGSSQNDVYEFGDGIQSIMDDFKKRQEQFRLGPPFPYGLETLDKNTGGLSKKYLTIIGGRPSVGKTCWALNIAYNLATRGKKILIFSCETPEEDLRDRIISSVLEVDYLDMRTGNVDDTSLAKIQKFISGSKLNIPMLYCPNATLEYIKTNVEKYSPDFFIIDYLQMCRVEGNTNNRNLELEFFCNSLKKLAAETNSGAIVLSQLIREGEKSDREVPKLSDFKDSGGIEAAADVGIILQRGSKKIDKLEDRDMNVLAPVMLYVCKQRNGPVGSVRLLFYKKIQKLIEDTTNINMENL